MSSNQYYMSPASFEQPNNQKEKPDENPVEKEANFEGNESLVLISRLKHPNIAKQIVEVHYRQKLEQYNFYQDETWERHIPKGWTGEEPMQLLKGEESGEIISAGDLQAKLELLKPDKDDIRRALEQNIQKVSKKNRHRLHHSCSECRCDPHQLGSVVDRRKSHHKTNEHR